jgi:hypothetical protein
VPNHEVGVWAQTKLRWRDEGLPVDDLHWDWFTGEARWDLDPREYIDVRFDMIPPFEEKSCWPARATPRSSSGPTGWSAGP